jgi:hypothetical protein
MNHSPDISIRTARAADIAELRAIAALDSARLPAAPRLVATRDGEIVAALSLSTGQAIADPFQWSADAVALLRLRAAQLPGTKPQPLRRLARLMPAAA